MKQHIFIIGSKGIPAKYGGFESFVEKLTFYKQNPEIQYHVSCLVEKEDWNKSEREFVYNQAECFNVKALEIGPARAVIYDLEALRYCLSYIEKEKLEHPIIYVLACRIGPFIRYYKRKIEECGGKLFVNPDGHEWKRAKWGPMVRKYWKMSEKYMVKHADLLICDSKNIEEYIQNEYRQYRPNTTFIAYGSDTARSILEDDDSKVCEWYKEKKVKPHQYYLIVGRFVPENNYETMIREFMQSTTTKDLVIVTGTEKSKFYEELKEKTEFDKDKRIKFVGTVYDGELLKKIRENAYGYLHGHEVGGTNPSLLEALGSTEANLLLDVGFNKEVGEDGAVYWNKEKGSLSKLIERMDQVGEQERNQLGEKAKRRIKDWYSWEYIVERYEKIFGR